MNKAMQALRARRTVKQNDRAARPTRPTWWWLLAAFLVFAVIVTGAFIWQRSTRMTSQKIYDELSALNPSVTANGLEAKGYIYGGKVVDGWSAVNGEEFPWYQLSGSSSQAKSINKFVQDVREGRESVLRLYVQHDQQVAGVRVLWFDPNAEADWAEKPNGDQPATIHHDGKGQIREWWWKDGTITTTDKRFSRSIKQESGTSEVVLTHQPAVPGNPDAADTVIIPNDEVLVSYGES